MTIDGTDQPGTWAVADVLQVLPIQAAALAHNALVITTIPSGIRLHFAGDLGRTYEIQRSSVAGPSWTTLDTLPAPTDGILEYVDEHPPAAAAFYRVYSP
jgi:hypothetical protein